MYIIIWCVYVGMCLYLVTVRYYVYTIKIYTNLYSTYSFYLYVFLFENNIPCFIWNRVADFGDILNDKKNSSDGTII